MLTQYEQKSEYCSEHFMLLCISSQIMTEYKGKKTQLTKIM